MVAEKAVAAQRSMVALMTGRSLPRQHVNGLPGLILRDNDIRRALVDWFMPDGLKAEFETDRVAVQEALKTQTFTFGFPLRPYQRAAIENVEEALGSDEREILVAMAPGRSSMLSHVRSSAAGSSLGPSWRKPTLTRSELIAELATSNPLLKRRPANPAPMPAGARDLLRQAAREGLLVPS